MLIENNRCVWLKVVDCFGKLNSSDNINKETKLKNQNLNLGLMTNHFFQCMILAFICVPIMTMFHCGGNVMTARNQTVRLILNIKQNESIFMWLYYYSIINTHSSINKCQKVCLKFLNITRGTLATSVTWTMMFLTSSFVIKSILFEDELF